MINVTSRTAFAKRTDLGNAQRLAGRYAELIRYVHGTEQWHIWNGQAWAVDDTGQIQRFARDTVRGMQRDALLLPDGSDERETAAKWGQACEMAARLTAMVQLARAEPDIAVTVDSFDLHPWELNTATGIVDLRHGQRMHHDPARMHAQITAVGYEPAARAPQWEAFLRRVLPADDVRTYVQRLLGRSLVGLPMPGHEFPFLFGSGGTGKSTLLEIVIDVLGDYARIAPSTLLLRKQGATSGSTYDIAALRGKRLVVVEELSGTIDENVLKLITAASRLAARQIHQAEAEFPNVTSLWMASNNEPRINGSDTGLRRRVKQIVMDTVLDGPGYVGPLKAHIATNEREGVLAWLVRGCVDAYKHGLVAPGAVELATAELFSSNNPLLEWLEACCELDDGSIETAPALHASYLDWCSRSRRRVDYRNGRSATWARALKGAGLEPVRTATNRGYRGARLTQPPL